jgi:uncharacterized protein (DUF1330 family)
MATEPSEQDLRALAAADDGQPFVMLYLYRFVEGGRDRYVEFALRAQGMLDHIGGRVLYGGEVTGAALVGQAWDAIAVVRYPSRAAFAGMLRSAEYAALAPLRQGVFSEHVMQPMQDWPGR